MSLDTNLRGLGVLSGKICSLLSLPEYADKVQDQVSSDEERGAGRLLRQMLSCRTDDCLLT